MGRDGQGRGYETVSNSGDLPQALCGRETLNRLGKAALAVIDAPLEWAPVRWIAENIGVQLLLMLLVALWALRRRGVDVLALALPCCVTTLEPCCFCAVTMRVFSSARWPFAFHACLRCSICQRLRRPDRGAFDRRHVSDRMPAGAAGGLCGCRGRGRGTDLAAGLLSGRAACQHGPPAPTSCLPPWARCWRCINMESREK